MDDVVSEYRPQEMMSPLVLAMNAVLADGDWASVLRLAPTLHTQAMLAGETELAEMVSDLACIASDALASPALGNALVASSTMGVAYE